MITALLRRTPYCRRLENKLIAASIQRDAAVDEAKHRKEMHKQAEVQVSDLLRLLAKQSPSRPARFKLEDAMPEDQIERHLGGTADSAVVKAIVAAIGTRIVRLSDQATDAPRETITQGERVIAGYTGEMRLHDAGGASALAELLRSLQTLTAHADEESTEKPKAA